MKWLLVLAALSGFAQPIFASQYSLDLKPDSTQIAWTLGDVLHTVHGTFRLKSGHLLFDPVTGAASGEIIVDVASGDSGNGARDKRMQENVLESAKYPEAVFVPDHIEGKVSPDGPSDVKIHGMFRIHGAAHEMTMDAQTRTAGSAVQASLSFSVPYVSWGMKDPSTFVLRVGKTVQLAVQTSGTLTKK